MDVKIKTEPTTGETEWHWIHDFFHGFGYCKNEQYIWLNQAYHFLEINSLEGLDLDEVYARLEPLLAAHYAKLKEYYDANPISFTKISIPNIKRHFPDPDAIRNILLSDSLKGA